MRNWIELLNSFNKEANKTNEIDFGGFGGLSQEGFSEFSKTELETLRLIYQKTIADGSAHHSCKSPEQAKAWCEFLNYQLPSDRDVCVIRDREINTYTLSIMGKTS